MSFISPWLLLAGLGVSLPLFAHLLNRYQVKQTPWAAMQFLDRSVRVRSRQLRLRDLLLLCLRCLAVLLLALAWAQPSFDSTSGSRLPGESRAGVVIALDASFSMQHQEGNSTRFERGLELIEVIAEGMQKGDPISLVLLGAEHQVVARNMAFDLERFRELLQDQKATDEILEWDRVANRLLELSRDMVANHKEVYIVTDFQVNDWGNADRLTQELTPLAEQASIFMVPVLGSAENLAVTELEWVSGSLRKGSTARYQATVRNCGSEPLLDVEVLCRADEVQIDRQSIPTLAPGSSETVALTVPFYNSGATRITAEVRGDALKADNVRRTVALVRDRVSILCVDGSQGDAGRLLVSALLAREDGLTEEDYQVMSVPWLSLPAQNLDDFDVVILANVPTLTSEQTNQLSSYVRRGNGLVWFAGDQVKPADWNAQTTQGGAESAAFDRRLLPAVLGQSVDCRGALGAGKPLDPDLSDHILCRPLQSLPEDLLSETRFLQCLEVEPSPTSFPILNLAGSPAPVLLEHRLGRGQVLMFTTSADATWNNMALTPVFPMLMQQIVTYLAGREFEFPRLVGDSLSLAYTEQPDASDAVFDSPSNVTFAVPVRQNRQQYVALLESAKEAGFYEARVSVQSPGVPIAVNVDTQESEVACLSKADLVKLFEDTDVILAENKLDLVSAIDAQRTTKASWRFFMIAGLLFLVLESLVADRKQAKIGSRSGVLSWLRLRRGQEGHSHA